MLIDPPLKEYIEKARVARLATVDTEAFPHLVPVVFAFDTKNFFIPIDEKKKSVKPDRLKRLRNIENNPNVALLLDQYTEDWSQLNFVVIQGMAFILRKETSGDPFLFQNINKILTIKYPQYQKIGVGELLIMIKPRKIISWKND